MGSTPLFGGLSVVDLLIWGCRSSDDDDSVTDFDLVHRSPERATANDAFAFKCTDDHVHWQGISSGERNGYFVLRPRWSQILDEVLSPLKLHELTAREKLARAWVAIEVRKKELRVARSDPRAGRMPRTTGAPGQWNKKRAVRLRSRDIREGLPARPYR